MKLFLDDTRSFPTGFDFYCRDTATAKTFLSTLTITYASFDYNLSATCKESGLDLLRWMASNSEQIHIPEHINVHSDHLFGKDDMVAFVKASFPNTKITSVTLKK